MNEDKLRDAINLSIEKGFSVPVDESAQAIGEIQQWLRNEYNLAVQAFYSCGYTSCNVIEPTLQIIYLDHKNGLSKDISEGASIKRWKSYDSYEECMIDGILEAIKLIELIIEDPYDDPSLEENLEQ